MGTVTIDAVRVDYPKQWFVIGTVIVVAATATMVFLALDAIEDFARGFWLACALLIGSYLMLLLIPPLFTCHYAGQKGLRLRMGLLLNVTIPYTSIEGIREESITFGGVRVGIGVKYVGQKGIVYVTSSFSDLTSITLRSPQEMGSFVKRPINTIVLSVKDREGFAALVKDRAGLEGA